MHVGSKRLLVVALVAVAAVPWVFVVRTLKDAKPPSVRTARPTSVVWDNRVFDSQHALAAWLRSRGASYETWAAAHPELDRILNPRSAPAPARQTTQAPARAAGAPHHAHAHARSRAAAAGSSFDVARLLRRLLVLAAKIATALLILALVVFSLGPDRLIVRVRPELTATTGTVELRAAAFAAAVSLAVGLAAAQLL